MKRRYLLFSMKLLIRLVRQFNLFIDEIFAVPFDKRFNQKIGQNRIAESINV